MGNRIADTVAVEIVLVGMSVVGTVAVGIVVIDIEVVVDSSETGIEWRNAIVVGMSAVEFVDCNFLYAVEQEFGNYFRMSSIEIWTVDCWF